MNLWLPLNFLTWWMNSITSMENETGIFLWAVMALSILLCELAVFMVFDKDKVSLLQNDDFRIHLPAALTYLLTNKAYNWLYESTEEPLMHNRRIAQTRGKVLGGSSCINGMIYIRGDEPETPSHVGFYQHGLEGGGKERTMTREIVISKINA